MIGGPSLLVWSYSLPLSLFTFTLSSSSISINKYLNACTTKNCFSHVISTPEIPCPHLPGVIEPWRKLFLSVDRCDLLMEKFDGGRWFIMCVSVSSWVLDPNEFQSSKNLSLSHECTLSVGLITG